MGESTFMVGEGVDAATIEEAISISACPWDRESSVTSLASISVIMWEEILRDPLENVGRCHPSTNLFTKLDLTVVRQEQVGSITVAKNLFLIQSSGGDQKIFKEKGVKPKKLSPKEIVDRMLARAINEASFMIEEGICDRPQDMDLAVIYGLGFPPYRGGICRYADAWGIRNVYEHLLKLEKEQGVRFKPASLLKEMADSDARFMELMKDLVGQP